jgi:hypothetical protein
MRLAFIPASCLPYALDNYYQNEDEGGDNDDDHDHGYMIDARAFQEVFNHRMGSDERKKAHSTVGGGGGVVSTRGDHNRSDGTGPGGAVVMIRGVTGELAWDGDIGVMKR